MPGASFTQVPLSRKDIETVVIGGGQARLAVGYHLRRQNREFLILDANERIGDSWRKQRDSLRLCSARANQGSPT